MSISSTLRFALIFNHTNLFVQVVLIYRALLAGKKVLVLMLGELRKLEELKEDYLVYAGPIPMTSGATPATAKEIKLNKSIIYNTVLMV